MRIFKILIISFLSIILFFIASYNIVNFLYPPPEIRINQSKILYSKNNEIITIFLNGDDNFLIYEPNIPKRVKNFVINYEDKHFYNHFGVNPISLFRALITNITANKKIGGSTITMQLVKLLNPKPRTLQNKVIEIFNAIYLERHYNKEQILNAYLNLAPYGKNLVGIKTASKFYFNKNLDELDIAQIATLAVIPKNPNNFYKNFNKKFNDLLHKLLIRGQITKDEFNRNKSVSLNPKSFVNKMPNFSRIMYKNKIFKSDIDLRLQNFIKSKLKSFDNYGIFNASAVLIDNKDMSIVAYVSSNDFNKSVIDGIKFQKNVGSTLKPFIYGLAFDNGLITPTYEMLDIKFDFFNGYSPKNYNESYDGFMSVANALRSSINSIAVRINQAMGDEGIIKVLNTLNIKSKNNPSIALGSVGIDLLTLTHLYTILANDGVLKPLKFPKNRIKSPVRILSIGATSLVKEILGYKNFMFKTGTSENSRNLYAILLSDKFTLGIWYGNFNQNPPNAKISGSDTSLIVGLEIFDYLDKIYKFKNFIKNGTYMSEFGELPVGVNFMNRCDFLRFEEFYKMKKNNIFIKCNKKFPPKITGVMDLKLPARLKINCLSLNSDDVFISVDDGDYNRTNKEIYRNFGFGEHSIKCIDMDGEFSEVNFKIKGD